jgi:hypothetical protein
VSLSEQVMFVSFKSYRTGQVSLSEQMMFVSFKSYRTGKVSLSEQNGRQDESNIVYTLKSEFTSQNITKNVKKRI